MSDASYAEFGKMAQQKSIVLNRVLRKWGTFGAFILMVIFFSVTNHYYFTPINFSNMLFEAVIPISISLGLTIVIMVGSFDLSIGAIASFGGMVSALLFPKLGAFPACLIALGAAGVFGLINGILVGVVGISGIIATLAMQFTFAGIETVITGGIEVPIPMSFPYFLAFGQGSIGPIKIMISALVILAIVAHLFMTKTAWGIKISATGLNAMASIYSGIKIKFTVILAFFLSAIFCSLAGIMIVAVNASHQPATANLYLLDAFCIVFLGSTILKEGKPHILGTVIAGIMLSGLVTGMMLMGVRYEWQMFVKGTVLVLAMAASVMMGHEGIRTRFV